MNEIISTHSVARGFVEVDEIELSATSRTRIVFRPAIHSGGVRGFIIRQKIGRDGNWKDINEVNFNSVAPDCGISIELNTEALSRLHENLSHLYALHQRGVQRGDQTYVVGAAGETIIVNDQTMAIAIQKLLDEGHSESFWNALIRSDPDLASRFAAAHLQFIRQQAIAEFE